jgi:hypothetical protein
MEVSILFRSEDQPFGLKTVEKPKAETFSGIQCRMSRGLFAGHVRSEHYPVVEASGLEKSVIFRVQETLHPKHTMQQSIISQNASSSTLNYQELRKYGVLFVQEENFPIGDDEVEIRSHLRKK